MRTELLKRCAPAVATGLVAASATTSADEHGLSVRVHSGYAGATEIRSRLRKK